MSVRPRPLRYVLITDGSSDACLLHPINWLLNELGWDQCEGIWADLRHIPGSGTTLDKRVELALEYHPAELLIVHRDAEKMSIAQRSEEIQAAIAKQQRPVTHVCIIPVRMTEAWLLHDEASIRRAAGKPRGKSKLDIPSPKQFETLPDPKHTLLTALLSASEASGRRLKQKRRDFGRMRMRVAELIDDYTPLRGLPAFQQFELELSTVLTELGAQSPI